MKNLLGLLSVLFVFGAPLAANASPYYGEFGVCCSQQMEVAITPFDLVTSAYQGQFEEQGIKGFATFDSNVASKDVTGEDLVRAAYSKYRASYADLMGETDLIKDVDSMLKTYNRSR